MSVLDDLETMKKKMLTQTGMEPRELLVGSGQTLIELYKQGFLSPNDHSLQIIIPAADWKMVQEFLKTFKGPK